MAELDSGLLGLADGRRLTSGFAAGEFAAGLLEPISDEGISRSGANRLRPIFKSREDSGAFSITVSAVIEGGWIGSARSVSWGVLLIRGLPGLESPVRRPVRFPTPAFSGSASAGFHLTGFPARRPPSDTMARLIFAPGDHRNGLDACQRRVRPTEAASLLNKVCERTRFSRADGAPGLDWGTSGETSLEARCRWVWTNPVD